MHLEQNELNKGASKSLYQKGKYWVVSALEILTTQFLWDLVLLDNKKQLFNSWKHRNNSRKISDQLNSNCKFIKNVVDHASQ